MKGRFKSSRTRVTIVIVKDSPGFSTGIDHVMTCPSTVIVPPVAVADCNTASFGTTSTTATLVAATVPGFDTVIVHVTVSPGTANGRSTLLLMIGSRMSITGGTLPVVVVGCPESGVKVGVGVSVGPPGVFVGVGVSVGPPDVLVAVGVSVGPPGVLVEEGVIVCDAVGVSDGVKVCEGVGVSDGVSV